MFYHRPTKIINIPPAIINDVFQEMMKYGYLLPNFVPLLTRFMCKKAGTSTHETLATMHKYKPYSKECFGKRNSSHPAPRWGFDWP